MALGNGKLVIGAAWLWLAAPVACAQTNCVVSLQTLAFGSYMPFDPAPLDVTGSVDFSCRGQPAIIQVAMSAGNSGTFSSREMTVGPFTMLYNVFADAARTLIWGDGTGGTVVNGATKADAGREDFSFPAYGRIPARQDVGAGVYTDVLIVTVTF